MFSATFALSALLATTPAIANQPDAARQLLNPDSSAVVCPQMCAAGRASAPWIMTGRDNPDSTVVEDEKAAGVQRSPTNDQINAAETGNPESVDFRYSNQPSSASGGGSWDLQALEAENPDSPQSGKVAHSVSPAAARCSCTVSAAGLPMAE